MRSNCGNGDVVRREKGSFRAGYPLTMATRFLTLGAATLITCLLISIGLLQFRQAKELSNAVSQRMLRLNDYLQEEELRGYDNVLMKGSDVINFYRRFFEEKDAEFAMTIIKADKRFTFREKGEGKALTTKESESYCKPSASFDCRVIKNENGVIVEVEFEERIAIE